MKHWFDVPLKVRPQVAYFAGLMENALTRNDHKGGWDECHPLWLHAKLSEEAGELGNVLTQIYHPSGESYQVTDDLRETILAAIQEAADIANVAMMLADRLSEGIK
jgi:hypothetical protein